MVRASAVKIPISCATRSATKRDHANFATNRSPTTALDDHHSGSSLPISSGNRDRTPAQLRRHRLPNRRLGRHLWEAGHGAGRRDRAKSRKLELEVIVPWLRREVDKQFNRFHRFAGLRRAACEIEAVTFASEAERRQRINRAQMPTARLTTESAHPKLTRTPS